MSGTTWLVIVLILVTASTLWLFAKGTGRNPTRPDGQPWEDRVEDRDDDRRAG